MSQAAWRARNKELVEEFRQEMSEYSEYSQSIHQTMQCLLEITESLKEVIVNALASSPPQKSPEIQKTMSADEQLMSPRSSNSGPTMEYDGEDTHGLT